MREKEEQEELKVKRNKSEPVLMSAKLKKNKAAKKDLATLQQQ